MAVLFTVLLGLACLIVGYLLGSIPTAVLIAKHYGVDIRSVGSHNAGGTNVGRVIGKKAGILTMVLDGLKAILPCLAVLLLVTFCPMELIAYPHLPELYVCLTGLAVALGHTFPLFAGFKGGKAVACFAGFILFVSPLLFVFGCLVFFSVLKIGKKVSLASVIGVPMTFLGSCVPMVLDLTVCSDILSYDGGLYNGPAFGLHLSYLTAVTVFLLALLIVARHLSNIRRLAKGTEPETKFK
jgi:glycerol-3-phosphate acyltransferase PlsY